jgi:hypothetical protein
MDEEIEDPSEFRENRLIFHESSTLLEDGINGSSA